MQNVVQNAPKEKDKAGPKNVEVGHATFGLTTGSTSPKAIMGKVQILPSLPQNFKTELSGSDEEEVSEVTESICCYVTLIFIDNLFLHFGCLFEKLFPHHPT